MLWLTPILAGSFLGLQVPNGPPTVDEVPSQRPLARRVLIPTWDLVVPVLSNSTPILEQNGPDSVVLMTEISESPRWLGTIRVVQLNAQSFAAATQSYIDGQMRLTRKMIIYQLKYIGQRYLVEIKSGKKIQYEIQVKNNLRKSLSVNF